MPDSATIDSPNAPPAPPKPGTLSTLVATAAEAYASREDRKAAERDRKILKSAAAMEAARAVAAEDQVRADIARMRANSWLMPTILLGVGGLSLFFFMRGNRKRR